MKNVKIENSVLLFVANEERFSRRRNNHVIFFSLIPWYHMILRTSSTNPVMDVNLNLRMAINNTSASVYLFSVTTLVT